MVKSRSSRLDRASGLPLISLAVNATTGFCPAKVLVTPVIVTTTLLISVSGFGGYAAGVSLATTCAPRMEASKGVSPCGIWQLAHSVSSVWNPPGWLAPVAKLTSSWQGPQAGPLGSAMNTLACAAPVVWSWQTSQRWGLAGSITVEKLLMEFM